VYLAGISDKDNQQEVIDILWFFFTTHKDALRKALEEKNK